MAGTGEKRNRLEESGTRVQSRERTEWAKVLRLPWTTAAGRHTETHDQRAHHHEGSCYSIFSGFLMRQYLLTTYVTGFCSVAVLYTLYGERPRNSQGRGSAVCVPPQTVRQTW